MIKLILAVSVAVLMFGCKPSLETMKEKPPASVINVVPRPQKVQATGGVFTLNAGTRLIAPVGNNEVSGVVRYFREQMNPATGFGWTEAAAPGDTIPANAIVFTLDSTLSNALGAEGYRLQVTPRGVRLFAAAPAGLFYGVQTIRQLLPPAIYKQQANAGVTWSMPCVNVEDAPRFSWRGMHLDVSRHFFPKEFIKEYLDILAMHKMNVFHWHLTDDNGWRLEIKKYPRLTSVGAWRVDRENLPWRNRPPQQPGEQATYGGFYTQDDVREILAYAKERFIMVLPEIEMPGHSVDVLAAYPQLSCFGGPFTVMPGSYWPNVDIFCAGNDSTFTFLQDVLDEVAALFPSPYIHVGGDEANKTNWKKCPKCQARIASEHLNDETELQSYFMHRIEKHLNAIGKKMIGWDEILEGGLAPNATVMSWRGMQGGIAAAQAGHDVVMVPTDYCYFDYYQAKSGEPEAIGGYVPLDTVYAFEPVPAGLSADQRKYILGAQANLWTEYIPTTAQAEYMLLPRLSALSEVEWTRPELKDYADFQSRMTQQYRRFDQLGVNYRKPTREDERAQTGEARTDRTGGS